MTRLSNLGVWLSVVGVVLTLTGVIGLIFFAPPPPVGGDDGFSEFVESCVVITGVMVESCVQLFKATR